MPARPVQSLAARNQFCADNDLAPDVLSSHLRQWISHEIASRVLNGHSGDVSKNMPAVQSFVL